MIKLRSKLSSIVDFAFKGGNKTLIRLSNNGMTHWRMETKGGLGFGKISLKTAINHLIPNSYFYVGNMTMKESGIPMESTLSRFGQIFFCVAVKKNVCHHYVLLKSGQGASTQQCTSLMIFAP